MTDIFGQKKTGKVSPRSVRYRALLTSPFFMVVFIA